MQQVPTVLHSHLKLADTPNAASWARLHTRDVLGRWQVPPDLIDTVLLVLSELVTNAIQHPNDAKQPERLTSAVLSKVQIIGLDLQLRGPAVLVQVTDNDTRPPVPKTVDTDSERGRGLFLVEYMSSRWGYYHPTNGSKTVWAEVRPGAAAPKPRAATAREPSNRAGRPRPFKPLTDEKLPVDDPHLMGRLLVGLRQI
ncbi:ATP-binding protein [Streptomyces tateyamensis]|uniref:ATP-binding protein n=1 Tax=Streptomyces tateyamensis TaxID=565073 RepID=A0A2V4PC82_9ACTN|nr:ATP-binding protein [Streptomyces tateyamensis]PYC82603.1 ATP-binding protein [Streptomyces tateyamensis]